MTPMKTNRGTAIRVTLVITPQMRRGNRLKNDQPKPIRPKHMAVPINVKVTGKPAISRIVSARNIHAGQVFHQAFSSSTVSTPRICSSA
jgi:hypothetical protein